ANRGAVRVAPSLQLSNSAVDRAAGQPGCQGRGADPAIALGKRFIRREQTSAAFVEELSQQPVPRPDVFNVDHTPSLAACHRVEPNNISILFLRSSAQLDSIISRRILSSHSCLVRAPPPP